MTKYRLFLLVVLFMVINPLRIFGESDIDSDTEKKVEEHIARAEELFKTATEEEDAVLFLQSAGEYQKILDAGMENEKLYYNLGNAYIKADQLGYAILNYRRALLYKPWDNRIRANLNHARDKQKNELTTSALNEVLDILLLPSRFIPPAISVSLFLMASLLLWGSLIFRLFNRESRVFITLPVVLMLLSGAIIAGGIYDTRSKGGVIVAESTVGRNGDSTGYASTFSQPLFQGLEFTMQESRPGWYLVKLDSGDITWLESSACELVR